MSTPELPMSMDEQDHPFRYYLRVRFDECDAQRVVFNARYGAYVDVATIEFFRTLGFAKLLINGPLDYQLVKQTLEWKAPARFDDVVEISLRVKHQGTTSFSMLAQFRIAGQAPLIATAETIYVLVDAATLAKTPLPDELRRALEEGIAGQLVDHASCVPRRSRE
jgi:acyl-CoA thioester hydrolase